MSDDTRSAAPHPAPDQQRKWTGPMLLATAVLVPIGILIFSNLSVETVSWLGFEFTAPLWLILIATFIAGMFGGKVFGWGWRRYRRRRQQLKEELEILRKHAGNGD